MREGTDAVVVASLKDEIDPFCCDDGDLAVGSRPHDVGVPVVVAISVPHDW